MAYKDSLNLPQTDFKMKANLSERETNFLEKWEEENLYKKIMDSRKDSEQYLLHDGPPYANGDLHMGHALNKLLKDIVMRFKTLKGYKTPYIPGWDCHGLPIELKVTENVKEEDLTIEEFRKKCRNYAFKYVKKHVKEFKRYGVLGEWEKPYLTLHPNYEANVLEVVKTLAVNGFIYKQKKPVHWCPSCHTALAFSEVEYKEHQSPSIYVKFEDIEDKNTYFVIWTTTPWTIPANYAIALNPHFKYLKLKVNDEYWIVAEKLWEDMAKKIGIEDYEIVDTYTGDELAGKKCQHPLIENRKSKVVLADYVTAEEGTGCVHTAPGHGEDDFYTGLKHDLPIFAPVDDRGRYTEEFEELEGQKVLESNEDVVELLKNVKALINVNKVTHSYPHCERCKNPVIFRATEQWFIDVDKNDLRKNTLKSIKDVKWVPPTSENRITSMVAERPDWCISRQRSWGIPLPFFHCDDCGEDIIDNEKIFNRVIEFVKENGTDAWFVKNENEILGDLNNCPNCGSGNLVKSVNILDVWIDSGSSFKSVVEAWKGIKNKADMYLEGSDQHRGWFQSSILLSNAVNNQAPFNEVITHGFVVDANGKKMSKSIGNVTSPKEIIEKYGADSLRLWVASENYRDDVPVSDEIMKRVTEAYRRIRNTFRFILGNLYDFDPDKNRVKYKNMPELDRYMLYRLKNIVDKSNKAYENYNFHKIYHMVRNFCVKDLSGFYLDGAKSVLYPYREDSIERRSIQTVMWDILKALTKILSPILVYTTEEVWEYLNNIKKEEDSVHLSYWPEIEIETDKEFINRWDKVYEIRGTIQKLLEAKRENGEIGHALDSYVYLFSENDNELKMLQNLKEQIKRANVVSNVYIEKRDDMIQDEYYEDIYISVEKSPDKKCARCWEYSHKVGSFDDYEDLCERCREIVLEKEKK
ncbi:MAG: isoleucine--tRNA ligase [Candidatus Mcinerneyibacterium aminivorans]|uniref:Isoleucine--tRNA ligase n=1 Tax=Candidatus Mcinerneyibacterium aminivorans TaxID=2703815 RepID=A0A5D0MIA7_9BACT|nr:MAG: isoleucine--tRNA ligase [Candidatus Mcinerneyibacterium aminivorans]